MRTAAQEEQRRFLKAEVTSVPNTAFAQETHRLIRASLRGCIGTYRMGVEFVKAGPLALDICLVDAKTSVKIHEKWLTKASSTKELGVSSTLVEGNVLFHTISGLFSDILHGVYAGKSNEVEKQKQEQICAEQRLLEYLHMKRHLSLSAPSSPNSQLKLRWDGKSSWGDNHDDNNHVSVQLHHESTCSHFRQNAFASECKFLIIYPTSANY